MKTIKYYNPKNNKYQTSKVLDIQNDVVTCLNVKANYQYTESLAKLREFQKAENPNWHNKEVKKPLVILNF